MDRLDREIVSTLLVALEPQTIESLAQDVKADRPTVGRHLTKLEKAGVAELDRDKTDARQCVARLKLFAAIESATNQLETAVADLRGAAS